MDDRTLELEWKAPNKAFLNTRPVRRLQAGRADGLSRRRPPLRDRRARVQGSHRVRQPVHAKEMPVTIGLFINPGHFGELPTTREAKATAKNRSFEYDTLSPAYATFVIDEMIPHITREYQLSITIRSGYTCPPLMNEHRAERTGVKRFLFQYHGLIGALALSVAIVVLASLQRLIKLVVPLVELLEQVKEQARFVHFRGGQALHVPRQEGSPSGEPSPRRRRAGHHLRLLERASCARRTAFLQMT